MSSCDFRKGDAQRRWVRGYLWRFGGAAAAAVAAVAGLNLMVDPFGVAPEGLPLRLDLRRRPYLERNEYLHKAYAVAHVRPATVFLGSSRVCVGMPAVHPAVQQPAYNCGLTAAGPVEMLAYLRHVLALGSVREIYLGLDMGPFYGDRRSPPSFDPEILLCSDRTRMPHWGVVPAMLSLDALFKSLRTLMEQEGPPIRYVQGMRDAEVMRRRIGGESWRATQRLMSPPTRDEHAARFQGDVNPVAYAALVQMIRLCRTQGVRLHVFVNPLNGIALDQALEGSRWSELVAWKRRILDALEEASAGDGVEAGFWDFATFHSYAYLSPPARYDSGEWPFWWEASHYKAELGGWMMSIMAGEADPLVHYVHRQNFDQAMTDEYAAGRLFAEDQAQIRAALRPISLADQPAGRAEVRSDR